MEAIEKKYVTDEDNNIIAVQMDIETFRKIERLLEDHVLAKLIEENEEKDNLNLNEAREYYDNKYKGKKKLNKALKKLEPKKVFKSSRHLGKVKWDEDALEYQKRIRGEWT